MDKDTNLWELALEFAFGEYFSWTPYMDSLTDMTYSKYLDMYVDKTLPEDLLPVPWEPFESYDEEWIESEIKVMAYNLRAFYKRAKDLSCSAERKAMQDRIAELAELVGAIH